MEAAELEIIEKLQQLLCSSDYLLLLKQWGAKVACRFGGYREITIRLKSGKTWSIRSPFFLRGKPKRRRGRAPKRQKGALRHLGLELLGIIKKLSPALINLCSSMAVLCPSFVVGANSLRGFGIKMNDRLLQDITRKFSGLVKSVRVECAGGKEWKASGLRILISVDGGRIRERTVKRGRRKEGLKRQGYSTEWFEPRLLIITQFDENGKKIRSVNPILDGACGDMDEFFQLLKEHLSSINIEEAKEVVFCADGGQGIWPRTEKLIEELGITNAGQILDYTHAKQNANIVNKLITDTLKLSAKESKKITKQIRDLLWNGNISGISALVKEKLGTRRKAAKAALKKLDEYFGNHNKFQYQTFQDKGLPTGSGSIESAIRRVINLRIKGSGLFWKKKNAEGMILLRSLVLTGKLNQACRKVQSVVRRMFDNNMIEDLPVAA